MAMKHLSAFIIFTREIVSSTIKVGSIPALAFGVWQGGLLCMYFLQDERTQWMHKDGLIPGRKR